MPTAMLFGIKMIVHNEQPTIEITDEYEDHINLIYRIARAYPTNARCDLDDYVSVGMAAYAEAKKSFDPERGIKLITYVYRPIKNAIEKEFQNNANVISGCTPYFINKDEAHRDKIRFINNTTVSLSTSRRDLSDFFHIAPHAYTSGKSIQPSLKEMIVESGTNCPQECAERTELIEKVDAIIESLEPEEQDIIYRRFFNEDSFQKIADATNLTWRVANGRYHKCMEKLRDRLIEVGLNIYCA